jgi:hypothetical protein
MAKKMLDHLGYLGCRWFFFGLIHSPEIYAEQERLPRKR